MSTTQQTKIDLMMALQLRQITDEEFVYMAAIINDWPTA